MITRGLKSSPTANLEILAGLQPINLKLQEQVLKGIVFISDGLKNMQISEVDLKL